MGALCGAPFFCKGCIEELITMMLHEAIQNLEQLRMELQQKLDAVDTALRMMRQMDDDITIDENRPKSVNKNKIIKNPPMDFSLIKDMNTGGGGIRCDL
jgi:hypothetical protein